MASGTRGLFLQIGGNVDNLAVAAKAGKSILAQLGTDAVASIEDIQDAFGKLGGGKAEESARSIQQTYSRTFAAIRANAQAVLDAPTGSAALGIVNVTAANENAAAAERQASGLRLVADAAARASAAEADGNVQLRTFATASAAAAVGAEQQAVALREQAVALGLVHGQLVASGEASDVVVAGHNRMSASGLILQHVVRSTGDSFAAGLPPAQIFAEQLGRLGEAASFLAAEGAGEGGALAGVASFLTGPWGIALTFGVSLLSPLIAKLFDTKEAAEEAKKATEDFAHFQDDLGNFIDRANGKLIERNRLLAEGARIQRQADINTQVGKVSSDINSAATAIAAKVSAGGSSRAGPKELDLSRILVDLRDKRDIGAANAALQALVKSGRADLGELAATVNQYAGSAELAAGNVHKLQGEQRQLDTALAGGVVTSSEVIDRRVTEATATTALEKAQAHLNEVKAEGAELDKAPYDPAAYARYKADLTSATEAVKRLQLAKKDAADDRQVGRQVTLDEAKGIVESIGGRVTSGYRSTAKQAELYAAYQNGTGSLAAKPGTSLHETGQALDIAKTPGLTLSKIVEAFRSRGVSLTERLDEGNHFHVAFGKKGTDPEVAARREQVRGANDDRAYQGELRQADDAILSANADLANTTEARSAAALARLRSDLAARDTSLQDQVTAGKLTQAEADILKVKLGSAEYEQEQLEQRKAQSEQIQRQAEADQLRYEGDAALLQLEAALATTTKARRDIALKLLALDEQRERSAQNAIINDPSSTKEQRDDANTKLAQIDDRHPLEVQQINRQDASPLAAYRTQLQSATGSIQDSLQGVAVDGLKEVEDSFVGVISGTETVAGAFKKMAASIISDLARIVIERAILGAIGGGAGGGGSIGGFFSSIFGHADGGHIQGPGTGRSDSILARLSNGEFVVNAAATARHLPLLHAMNDNSLPAFADGGLIGSIPQMRDLSNAEVRSISSSRNSGSMGLVKVEIDKSSLFDTHVRVAAAPLAQAAVVGGSNMAQREISEHQYQAIP